MCAALIEDNPGFLVAPFIAHRLLSHSASSVHHQRKQQHQRDHQPQSAVPNENSLLSSVQGFSSTSFSSVSGLASPLAASLLQSSASSLAYIDINSLASSLAAVVSSNRQMGLPQKGDERRISGGIRAVEEREDGPERRRDIGDCLQQREEGAMNRRQTVGMPLSTWQGWDMQHHCRNCGKGFAYGHSMVRHRRKCEGMFSYTCNLCGKQFYRRDLYVEHMSTQHHVTEIPRRGIVYHQGQYQQQLQQQMMETERVTYQQRDNSEETIVGQRRIKKEIPDD